MRTLRGSAGFTIIELMISLFIATLAIGGYIGTNIIIQRFSEELNERTIAIQDAARVIEHMRNASRTGTFPSNVVTAFPNNNTVAGFDNLANEQVRVSYANTAVNPLDATVTVTWFSYARRQNSEAIRTYITQR